MKIVKQIDETHFEVEMEPWDKDKEIKVSIAHDYLAIGAPNSFCTSIDIKGEYNSGPINGLLNYNTLQIPIRATQEILRLIKDYKYLKPEHLICRDGKLNYLWNNYPIKFKDEDGVWRVAVRGDNEEKYSILSLAVYNKLTKGLEND
jgi:hypothetical protein